MLYRETLGHLVEIQFLMRKEHTLLAASASEINRISALEKHLLSAHDRLVAIEEELKSLKLKEKELIYQSHIEKENKLKEQLNFVSNEKEANALSATLIDQAKKKVDAEHELYSGLEREDLLNTEKKEKIDFLDGIKNSIKEIESEVNSEVARINLELEVINKRKLSLLEQCRKDVLPIYERATKKHPKNPLSAIVGGNCEECRMMLNSVLKSQVENMTHLEPCPYCERILLPHTLNN